MKWRIAFARTAEKEVAKLSAEMRLRIGRAIRGLEFPPLRPQLDIRSQRSDVR